MSHAHAHTGAPGPQTNAAATPPVLVTGDDAVAAMKASVTRYGFGELPRSLHGDVLAGLRAEAETQFGGAVHAESGDEAPLRYRARVAGLGDYALSLLKGPEMAALLEGVFGQRFTLSENISCYTFYNSDDHLGAHQDSPAEQCQVTIIVYLHATSPDRDAPDTGLVLNVYGEEPDSVGHARLRIATVAGSLVLGAGSRFWHERPRLKPGETVTAITGCYRRPD